MQVVGEVRCLGHGKPRLRAVMGKPKVSSLINVVPPSPSTLMPSLKVSAQPSQI